MTQVAPSASVDDHRAWIERMRSMTGATVFAGIGILVLVIAATIISVSFATRGAMAANRPIVEVLHFVGAGDSYIANRFLRHFLRLGLEGGLIGGGAAMLAFGFSESIAGWFSGTPVGDQFAALLGTFSLPPVGLSGAGGAGGADRRDHRLGLAANAVRHAGRHRLTGVFKVDSGSVRKRSNVPRFLELSTSLTNVLELTVQRMKRIAGPHGFAARR